MDDLSTFTKPIWETRIASEAAREGGEDGMDIYPELLMVVDAGIAQEIIFRKYEISRHLNISPREHV